MQTKITLQIKYEEKLEIINNINDKMIVLNN